MIMKSIKKYEILRFMAVGGVAAIVQYVVYVVLMGFKMPYNFAYAIGFAISLISNFFASNYFTFNTKPTLRRAVKFGISNGVNFINHMLLLNLFALLGVNKLILPPLVFTTLFPINYLLVRYSLKGRRGAKK